jgi:hypothetical protein
MGLLRRPAKTYIIANGIRIGMVRSFQITETSASEKNYELGSDRPAEIASAYSGGTLVIERAIIWKKPFIKAIGYAFKSIRDLNDQDVSIQEHIINPDGTVDVNTYHNLKFTNRNYRVTAGAGGVVVESLTADFTYVD